MRSDGDRKKRSDQRAIAISLAVRLHPLPAALDDAVLEIIDHPAADAKFGGAVVPDEADDRAVVAGIEAPPLAERHARRIDDAVGSLDQIGAVVIAIGEGAVLDRI